jgi:hypothetical protein
LIYPFLTETVSVWFESFWLCGLSLTMAPNSKACQFATFYVGALAFFYSVNVYSTLLAVAAVLVAGLAAIHSRRGCS